MAQRFKGYGLIESAGEVQGPQGFQGKLAGLLLDHPGQLRNERAVLAVTDEPQSGLPGPAIFVAQEFD